MVINKIKRFATNLPLQVWNKNPIYRSPYIISEPFRQALMLLIPPNCLASISPSISSSTHFIIIDPNTLAAIGVSEIYVIHLLIDADG